MNAVLDGDDRNIAKVIKKVAKEVVIEKPNKHITSNYIHDDST